MTRLDTVPKPAVIHDEARQEIIQNLWPACDSATLRYDDLDLEPYFCYYVRQCHDALIDGGRHVLARTHQDIVDVARKMEEDEPRDAIREVLRARLVTRGRRSEEDILDASMDLAARLHLMIHITNSDLFISRQLPVRWSSGTLQRCLENHFSIPQVLGNDHIKLEPGFTAVTLERIAGIQIKPTDNLADHLRLIDREDKIVAVFHHASFLKRQTR